MNNVDELAPRRFDKKIIDSTPCRLCGAEKSQPCLEDGKPFCRAGMMLHTSRVLDFDEHRHE